ncbi:hypothetical protein, partial [Citrobacter koseri]|uniref:hypothetical protein n=1 Tax=Citrobacter koseri TaxID=545 RepID=UPI001952CAC7
MDTEQAIEMFGRPTRFGNVRILDDIGHRGKAALLALADEEGVELGIRGYRRHANDDGRSFGLVDV